MTVSRRYIKPVFTAFIVVVLFASVVRAQIPSDSDSLIIVDGAGYPGETVSIYINLVNTFSVAGFSTRMVYDGSVIEPDSILLTERSSILDMFGADTSEAGVLRVWAVAFDGINTFIPPGSGEIVEIRFHIDESASPGLVDLALADSGFETYENSLTDSTGYDLIIPVLVNGALEVLGSTFIDSEGELALQYSSLKNYPNPFNNKTLISFNLTGYGSVRVEIYDILGRQVKTIDLGNLTPGNYSALWNGRDQFNKEVSSGVYCYALLFNHMSVLTNKMILLK